MIRKLYQSLLFILFILLLQQAIAHMNSRPGLMNRQVLLIVKNDIDPAAMFYTESDLVLAAEKQVSDKIKTVGVRPH